MKFFGWGIYKKLRRIKFKIQLNPPVLDMNEHDTSDYWDTYNGGTTQKLDRELHKGEVLAFMIDEEVLRNSVVLDLGCGFGRMNLFYDFKRYFGLDSNERMLDNAKMLNQEKSNAKFNLGDGRTLKPYPDCFFDVVICSTVMLHLKVKTVKGYAREVYRVLKSNGIFVVNFPKKRNFNVYRVFSLFKIEPLGDWKKQDDAFLFRKVVGERLW